MKIIITLLILSTIFLSCDKVTAPEDKTPPETPNNFRLLGGGDGQAVFRWDRNGEPDFKNYILYRKKGSGNSFSILVELTTTEFIDRFLEYDVTYYYRLTAIDYAGNESPPTNDIDVLPVNISSPSIPQNVAIYGQNIPMIDDACINVIWIPNTEGDLSHYNLYRHTEASFSPTPSNFIGTSKIAFFKDYNVEIGNFYYYRIEAVDKGGLKSLYASQVMGDVVLPQVVTVSPINGVSVSKEAIEFLWQPIPNAAGYMVMLSPLPSGEPIWSSEIVTGTNRTSYTGTLLDSGTTYYWWIAAYSKINEVDEYGNPLEPTINSQSEVARFFVQ